MLEKRFCKTRTRNLVIQANRRSWFDLKELRSITDFRSSKRLGLMVGVSGPSRHSKTRTAATAVTDLSLHLMVQERAWCGKSANFRSVKFVVRMTGGGASTQFGFPK